MKKNISLNPSVVLRGLLTGAAVAMATTGTVEQVTAAEPGWSPIIVPRGDYRTKIKSMPIEARPYRPLHFYGNTVRRNHYRSQSPQSRMVVPTDVRQRYGTRRGGEAR